MDPQLRVAWITSTVAIVSLAATLILQLLLRFLDRRAERKREVLRLRRDALHKALRVIDHVYANTSFEGVPPAKRHTWDIADVWDAWNMMILYCAEPLVATSAFAAAIGLTSDMASTPRVFGPADLAHFREIVGRELGVPTLPTTDPALIWIHSLPGTSQTS